MGEQAQFIDEQKRKTFVAVASCLFLVILVGVIVLLAIMFGSSTETTAQNTAEIRTSVKYIPPLRCQFPMRYRGRTYNDCTTVDAVYPWCFYGEMRFYCPAAKTSKGVCAMPFTYRGKTYDRCVNENKKYYWCALTPIYQPGMWDYCDPAMVASPNCVIPFNYKGRQYWGCTNANADYYWCSYTTDYVEGWDYCHPPTIEPDPSCKFPFTYRGHVYNTCTKQDDKYYWCARSSVYKSDNWVYCVNTAIYPHSQCTLPFKYKSNTYNHCVLEWIYDVGYRYWCSKTYKYDGEWKYCHVLDDNYRM